MNGRDIKVRDQHSDEDPGAASYDELSDDADDDMDCEGDGYWYVFGQKFLIDVDHCALCFVFPRGSSVGGVVDEDIMVEDPYEDAKRIFDRPMNAASQFNMAGFAEFQVGTMTMADYQDKVRARFLDLLMRTHLMVSSFDSIDGDEVFLKVGLNRHGQVIKELAERYKYSMPYRAEAYEDMPPWGNIAGGAPMKNYDGDFVYAHEEYSLEHADLFQPFRDIDETRLILMRLDRWIDIEELVEQNVITGFFPAIAPKAQRKLCKTWADPCRLLNPPGRAAEFEVRDYFGEEVAFFFVWMRFAIWGLAVLFVPSMGIYIARIVMDQMSASPKTTRILQKVFCCLVLFWAAGFSRAWVHHATRVKQVWGMQNFDYRDPELSSYDPYLEGTYSLWCRKLFGKSVIFIYLLLYVNILVGVEWLKQQRNEEDATTKTADWDVLILLAVVKVLSFAWSYIAEIVVKMQNHRTRTSYRDSLAFTLAIVKLFITLWPFFYLAFIQNATNARCFSDMQSLVGNTWPALATATNSSEYALFMNKSFVTQQGNRFCVPGCFVKDPFQPGDTLDTTNCSEQLRITLSKYYLYDQILTFIFLCIPVVRTKWSIQRELKIAASKVPQGEEPPPYSLLQYQSKCNDLSPYRYGSWGGSITEDFLQVITGFVLMMCFAIILPGLCCLALICTMMLYRLFAFRMTRVTCRPLPNGAEGIGFWEGFVSTCTYLAILSNVGIAVFNSWPVKQMDGESQLKWFIISEHSLFAVSIIAGFLVPSPAEVPVIQRYNDLLVASLIKHPPLPRPASENYDYSEIDISLRPQSRSRSLSAAALGGFW